jgi:hypothetical protein
MKEKLHLCLGALLFFFNVSGRSFAFQLRYKRTSNLYRYRMWPQKKKDPNSQGTLGATYWHHQTMGQHKHEN